MKPKFKVLLSSFVLILIVSGVFIWLSAKYKPIAKVNGARILRSDYESLLSSRLNELTGVYGKDIPIKMKEKVEKDVINELVNRRLLLEEAKNREIIVDKNDTQKMLKDIKASFKSDDEFNKTLNKTGISMENFKDYIRDEITIDKLNKDLGKNIKISEDEIRNYFDKNSKGFVAPEGYKIKIITVNNIKEAEDIMSKLKKGDMDFDKYALNQPNEFAKKINNINEFIGINSFPDGIKDRIKNINIGEYDGPIKEQNRFHIIKVLDKKRERPLQFEEVKNEISRFLLEEQKGKLFKNLIESKREKADIKIYK